MTMKPYSFENMRRDTEQNSINWANPNGCAARGTLATAEAGGPWCSASRSAWDPTGKPLWHCGTSRPSSSSPKAPRPQWWEPVTCILLSPVSLFPPPSYPKGGGLSYVVGTCGVRWSGGRAPSISRPHANPHSTQTINKLSIKHNVYWVVCNCFRATSRTPQKCMK